MKSFSLASLVLAVLLGVAVAWIRPAQPVQVAQPGAFLAAAGDGLDNPAVTADPNIHPARKCKYYTATLCSFLVCCAPVVFPVSSPSDFLLLHHFFLCLQAASAWE